MRVSRLSPFGLPSISGCYFICAFLVICLTELSSGLHPPHSSYHPHHPHHHHRKPKLLHKLRLLEFYGDGRSGKELVYPAAYVELKYPHLRHPRKNTLPPHPPHIHIHHVHPPPHPFIHHPHEEEHQFEHGVDEEGVVYPEGEDGPHPLQFRSGSISGPGLWDGEGEGPSSIITYTKTTTIEKDGGGGVTSSRTQWEPPIYEASSPSSHHDDLPPSPKQVDHSFKEAAPLVENLNVDKARSSTTTDGGGDEGRNVGREEKILKNVALDEYIWVRREEGTPNIRLTLDPVRRSTYFLDDVLQGRRIHIVSSERVCVSGVALDGRPASAAPCSSPGGNEGGLHWDFVSISHGQYWIQGTGTNHCLTPSFNKGGRGVGGGLRFVEMRPCDLYEPRQLWEVGSVPPISYPSPGGNNYLKGGY